MSLSWWPAPLIRKDFERFWAFVRVPGPVVADLQTLTGVEARRVSTSTRDIAAVTTRTGSGSGSTARYGASPRRSAARCGAEPLSSR